MLNHANHPTEHRPPAFQNTYHRSPRLPELPELPTPTHHLLSPTALPRGVGQPLSAEGCTLVALPECFAFIGAQKGEAQAAAEALEGPTMHRALVKWTGDREHGGGVERGEGRGRSMEVLICTERKISKCLFVGRILTYGTIEMNIDSPVPGVLIMLMILEVYRGLVWTCTDISTILLCQMSCCILCCNDMPILPFRSSQRTRGYCELAKEKQLWLSLGGEDQSITSPSQAIIRWAHKKANSGGEAGGRSCVV